MLFSYLDRIHGFEHPQLKCPITSKKWFLDMFTHPGVLFEMHFQKPSH